MSTPPIPELMRLWRKGELTAEQAAGYMLQHLVEWFHWRTKVERRLRQLEQPGLGADAAGACKPHG